LTGSRNKPAANAESPPNAAAFKSNLLALVPFLRAFARSLSGRVEGADDLAQEALVKAWQSRSSFVPGTNLKAWLFTILRNQFYSDHRRSWRQSPWDADAAERIPGNSGAQEWAAELSDVARALKALPIEQREALVLVGAGGFAYDEAAKISSCAVGTVKSRVARARKALIAILDGNQALLPSDRPPYGQAAREIMTQLDRLTTAHRNDRTRRGRKQAVV
jgi:RNA polymerase sigma-70 factor, ECF subfamily